MLETEYREMLALLEPMAVTTEEQELRDWIKSCKSTLKHYSAQEVASMAILCGFEPVLVYSVVSCFRDAMAGTHVEKRAAFQLWHFDQAIKDVQEMRSVKELDLRPLWKSVYTYQTGRE